MRESVSILIIFLFIKHSYIAVSINIAKPFCIGLFKVLAKATGSGRPVLPYFTLQGKHSNQSATVTHNLANDIQIRTNF